MNRVWKRLGVVGVVAAVATAVPVAPASATVHEIVGQWCSGQDELAPPGVTGQNAKGKAAQPLNANGFIQEPTPFDPPGDQPAGLLLGFDYDHPAGKVIGTGVYFEITQTPAGPLYGEVVAPDPDFAAFANCPNLNG
jgi:hypothetical protein